MNTRPIYIYLPQIIKTYKQLKNKNYDTINYTINFNEQQKTRLDS